jgi:hypothetical protein
MLVSFKDEHDNERAEKYDLARVVGSLLVTFKF